MNKSVFWVLAFVLMISTGAFSDAIWKSGVSTSPYSTSKIYQVGDIVYIVILESTSALSKAGTETKVKDDLSLSLTHTLDNLSGTIPTDASISPKVQNEYAGSGNTTRSTTIKAKVAARVTKVLDNGNIKLVGHHIIEVNGEEQEIIISGVVRSKDINQSNAVYSYQVANAKIVVSGSGMVSEAEEPGWITRVINWIF